MGHSAVVIDTVALVKDFNIVSDSNLERAFNDNIKFLVFVCAEMGIFEIFFGIRNSYEERFSDFIFEKRSKSAVIETFSSCNRNALSLSCNVVAVKAWALTFHKVSNFNTACVGELIDKCKAEIMFTAFI